MKISEILFAVPDTIIVVSFHGVYIFISLIFGAWAHSVIDNIRGKSKVYDPLCGMGPIFMLSWIIGTIFFCLYWGNTLNDWGY
tara:strand:+ start:522 stop:770 length:249 start_codon:yes stop_codon:yes gene_type:complete